MTRPRRAEVAAASALLAVGVLVAALARRLPYWQDYAPGPGFFPMWLGLLLAVTAAVELSLVLRQSNGDSADRSADASVADRQGTRRPAILAGLSVVAALLVLPLGFVLATALFVAAVSWSLDPHRRLSNAAATIVIPLGVWVLFVLWLGVPLPRGPLGF
jgi:putative tricarboxylic transport membrane protein